MLAKSKRVLRALRRGLVMTRNCGEDFQIDLPDGRVAIVTVVSARQGRVRLHVHAPPELRILRGELVNEEPTPHAA